VQPWKRWPIKASLASAALALLLAAPAGAADEGRRAELAGERSELRSRIRALQTEIERAEASRQDAAGELRDTEKAISAANLKLRQLAGERRRAEREHALLTEELAALEARIAVRQRDLAELLRRHARAGDSEALRLMLSGRDPNQVARDLHFLRQMSAAELGQIQELRAAQQERRVLAARVAEQAEALRAIEAEQKSARDRLAKDRATRTEVLARVSAEIRRQRREVGSLQKDEQRLSKLIAGLARITRRPPSATPGKPGPKNDLLPEPGVPDTGFARLKGKLRLPARGELAHRFGTPRPGGGPAWRGVFIRAEGGEVRAVASGTVVFADWLRGYGNLMIVDHGAGYLTIYGNNESLYRNVGDAVKTGDVIAAIGDSGGSEESGLYFEVRYQGQPEDPLAWARLQ